MIDQHRYAIFEQHLQIKNRAKKMAGITVTSDNVEVTVTVEQKETQPDLLKIKQLVSSHLAGTASTDFDGVIDELFDIVGLLYQGHDIEIMMYDNIECVTVVKFFNTFINPLPKGKQNG